MLKVIVLGVKDLTDSFAHEELLVHIRDRANFASIYCGAFSGSVS
jgi:hypothetical protein